MPETTVLNPPAPEAVAEPQHPSTPETPAPATSDAPATPPETPEAKPAATPVVPADAVPEKYEFKPVEGFEFDSSVIEAFQPVAKELGLTQDKAQKLVEFQAGIVKQAAEKQQVEFDELRNGWAKETEKVLGANKTKALEHSARFMDTFGKDLKVREVLKKTGLENHPDLVQLFARAGAAISEDTHIPGAAHASPQSAAKTIFDHPTSQIA